MATEGNGSSGEPVNVRRLGAQGDGKTDDTDAVQRAIDVGEQVYFPPGTYFVGDLRAPANKALDIVGNGRASVLTGCEVKQVGILVQSDEEDWRIQGVRFEHYPRVAMGSQDRQQVLKRLELLDIEVEQCGRGAMFACRVQEARINGFRAKHIINKSDHAAAIWLGDSVADKGDVKAVDYYGMGDFSVEHFHIEHVESGANAESHAVLLAGSRGRISNGYVRDVFNADIQKGNGGEGIYTKCANTIIENVILIDAGNGQAFINVKGGGTTWPGLKGHDVQIHNVQCIGNDRKRWPIAAMATWVGDVSISDVIIEGMYSDTCIYHRNPSDGYSNNISVSNTKALRNCTNQIISFEGGGFGFQCDGLHAFEHIGKGASKYLICIGADPKGSDLKAFNVANSYYHVSKTHTAQKGVEFLDMGLASDQTLHNLLVTGCTFDVEFGDGLATRFVNLYGHPGGTAAIVHVKNNSTLGTVNENVRVSGIHIDKLFERDNSWQCPGE